MKYFLSFVFLIVVIACDTASNIPSPDKNYFIKYFGGDGNQTAVDLIVNTDGSFFILGNSKKSISANQQVFLAKADPQGKLIWQKTFGDPSVDMNARDFELTSDGRLAVVANKLTSGSNMDVLLSRFTQEGVKTDSVLLQIQAQPTPKNEYANSITELSDGGFIISGYTDYVTDNTHQFDALHFRTDKNLNQFTGNTTVWKETSGSGTKNTAVKAFRTKSDTSYIFGYTNASAISSTDLNFWNFGLYSNGLPEGNSDASSEFVVSGSDEVVTNVIKSPLGGYVMSGYMNDLSNNLTIYIKKIKFDDLAFSQGDIQYSYTAKALGNSSNTFATACPSSTGYYILANTYTGGASDMILIKLDNLFQEAGTPVLLGGDGDDTAAAVAELPGGRIVVLGTMSIGNPAEQNKIALLKLNSEGKLAD